MKIIKHQFLIEVIQRGSMHEFFVRGKQIAVDSNIKKMTKSAGKIPHKSIDYLKHVFIKWQPSLDFGWISPEYKEISCVFEYTENRNYMNVMPIESGTLNKEMAFIEFEKDLNLHDSIESIDWLLGEPPTEQQIKKVREEIRKLRSSERFAYYMNWR